MGYSVSMIDGHIEEPNKEFFAKVRAVKEFAVQKRTERKIKNNGTGKVR